MKRTRTLRASGILKQCKKEIPENLLEAGKLSSKNKLRVTARNSLVSFVLEQDIPIKVDSANWCPRRRVWWVPIRQEAWWWEADSPDAYYKAIQSK